MDNDQNKWVECQEMIKQQLQLDWVWPTWFKPVSFESYDAQKRTILLQVPSVYVFEFLDRCYGKLIRQVISRIFAQGENVTVNYRILQNYDGAAVDFTLSPTQHVPTFSIPDAENKLKDQLQIRLGKYQWLPAYDKVVDWLSNNKGRGLLCLGTSGLGKSVICRDILPVIFGRDICTVKADELYNQIEDLVSKRCIIIDGLGTEDKKRFGQPDRSFYKLCDTAERNGILLIITTNLSTTPVSDPRYPESILQRYGKDVTSRLSSLVRAVEFEGKDMRI